MKMFPETSQNLSCCFVDRKSFSPGVPSLSLSPLPQLPLVPEASEEYGLASPSALPSASLPPPPNGPILSKHLFSILSCLCLLVGAYQGVPAKHEADAQRLQRQLQG